MWRKWIEERRSRSVPKQQEIDLEGLQKELRAQATELKMRMSVLENEFDKLHGQYKSMRGYVYAKRGQVEIPPEASGTANAPSATAGASTALPAPEPPQRLTRDELRRSLTQTGRFMPGKPPNHRE